eukprot:3672327-Pyramimonas_sp.AAC.1
MQWLAEIAWGLVRGRFVFTPVCGELEASSYLSPFTSMTHSNACARAAAAAIALNYCRGP